MSRQSGQALVEWGLSAFVLMLFAFGLLAVGQIVGEDMAIRSAATQAAFAAARAPSAAAAQQYGQAAAAEAIQGTQVDIDGDGPGICEPDRVSRHLAAARWKGGADLAGSRADRAVSEPDAMTFDDAENGQVLVMSA